MNFNEIQELIKLVNKSSLTEFKLKDKDFEIQIRTKKYYRGQSTMIGGSMTPMIAHTMANPSAPIAPVAAPVSATPSVPQESQAQPSSGKQLIEVKSPIVGTFYRSPGPDKPQFVKVGDTVKAGDVVCIIEAMKLFNEIECDATGTIVKVMVEDASPVEYDQVLYLVEA